MQMDQLIGRCLIGDADAAGEVNETGSAQFVLASCDIEPFALAQPREKDFPRCSTQYLMVGTRFSDHLAQRGEVPSFSGFRKSNFGDGHLVLALDGNSSHTSTSEVPR